MFLKLSKFKGVQLRAVLLNNNTPTKSIKNKKENDKENIVKMILGKMIPILPFFKKNFKITKSLYLKII